MIFQIGSALLDACVLSVLEREDMYGYILTQNVKEVVDISESTLYPVLRRLQKEAYLSPMTSRLQEETDGIIRLRTRAESSLQCTGKSGLHTNPILTEY